MHEHFTVCMAIYRNDNAKDFEDAVHSIYNRQTVKPSEIIIVVDGSIPSGLNNCLIELKDEIKEIKTVYFERNKGHAAVRQAGLEAASHDLIAIMDADDIAASDRFEKQLEAFSIYTGASVIGGQITEFIDYPENIVDRRNVPQSDTEIKKYLKQRCPMNLMTVMYRKKAVEAVGGFKDWYCEEDYYLWIRMAQAGYKFANLPDTLVNVRVGKDMYARRGGWKYFKSEAQLQEYMRKNNIINMPRYLFNVLGRFLIQVAMPNCIRGWVFQKLFRK